MIKAIIFDFDGVILESADIKTEAFRELFSDYPHKADDIIEYHLINGGISRYVKFRYIYEQILGLELSLEKEIELGERFSQLVLQKVLSVPYVSGAKEFLETHKSRYQFFIASGTPDEELRKIVYARKLQKYFKEIYGSPKKKIDIVNDIINNYNFSKDEVVYVGDAQSDRIATEGAEIVFVERRDNLDSKLNHCPWVIENLFNLSEVLKKIELTFRRCN